MQTEIGNHTGTGLKLWLWFEIADIAVSGQRKSLTQTRMENETELIPLIKISDENMTLWSGLLEFSGSESTQGFFLQISAEMWGDDAARGRLASLGGSREVRAGKRGVATSNESGPQTKLVDMIFCRISFSIAPRGCGNFCGTGQGKLFAW